MLWILHARPKPKVYHPCKIAPPYANHNRGQALGIPAQSPTRWCEIARQVAIGSFFADFCCREARLVIEIDGVTHETPEELIHDARRTAWLEAQGYRVIRFRNEELMGDLDAVLERIQISL